MTRPERSSPWRAATGRRVLHPHRIAGIEEQAGEEIERLLDARDDGDLARRAAHAAHGREVFGDRLAEARIAERATVGEEVAGPAAGRHPETR